MLRKTVPIILLLLLLVSRPTSASTINEPSWSTKIVSEPAIATTSAKQKLAYLINSYFSTPLKSELAHVHRRSPTVRRRLGSTLPPNSQLQPHDMLMVITTSNTWPMAERLLTSLAALTEHVDLLVVDECSTDGTRLNLAQLGVPTLLVNASMGVAHSWNLGYQHFVRHNYTYLVYADSEVLLAPGVLTNLKRALDRGCTLVSPLSTVTGKGNIGLMEGIEAVYNMTLAQANKVTPAAMYGKVQAALDAVYLDGSLDPVVTRSPDVEFSGDFFAVHRRIAASACTPGALFSDRAGGLEKDLNVRLKATGQRKCLDLGSFVWHGEGREEGGEGKEEGAVSR